MLIKGDQKFLIAPFDSEQELEEVVMANAEYIFGPSSFYIPRTLIRTTDGSATIPDGYAFDIAGRRWFIVEAELSQHNVWSHIAPQVAKQITASLKARTKQSLIDRTITQLQDDSSILEKFQDEEIEEINIRKELADILEKDPIIGIPIDRVSLDLEEWANTQKFEVKLWKIQKYVEFGSPTNILYEIPEEFRPTFDSEGDEDDESRSHQIFDASITDLLEAQMLNEGDTLIMTYKPRDLQGDRQTYRATVVRDGSLKVDDRVFSSASFAALYFIQRAGSSRYTVNGWRVWKTASGKSLLELRDEYLRRRAAKQPES